MRGRSGRLVRGAFFFREFPRPRGRAVLPAIFHRESGRAQRTARAGRERAGWGLAAVCLRKGSSESGMVVSSPPLSNALGMAAYRRVALRWFITTGCTRAARREPGPRPASAGGGATLTVAGAVNHAPSVPLARAGANPTPPCAVRFAPHLRNAAPGQRSRHAVTGPARETVSGRRNPGRPCPFSADRH
jgi:hypothetical protein